MPLFGPPDVEKMEASLDVKGLIKALDYKKDSKDAHAGALRLWAAKALSLVVTNPRAVETLIVALQEKEWYIREQVATGLGKIGDARAVEPLIPLLKDGYWDVRTATAEALGEIGDPRAVEPLITALREWNKHRDSVITALGKIGDERAVGLLTEAMNDQDESVRYCVTAALGKFGVSTMKQLITALEDSNPRARAKAADGLGKIGDPDAVGHLTAALNDPDEYVRKMANQGVLQQMDRLHGIEKFLTVLKYGEQTVRISAIGILGKLREPQAVDPLITELQNKDENTRAIAAQSLGMIGDSRAVKPLIVALNDPVKQVRSFSAWSLGQIGNQEAAHALGDALMDINQSVADEAATALDSIDGWSHVPTEQRVSFWLDRQEYERCASLGEPAIPSLIAALKAEKINVRSSAARALGRIQDPRSIDPLVVALKDRGWSTRNAAAISLDELGWHPDSEGNQAWYQAARGEWEKCVTLGKSAITPLICSLNDEDNDVRQSAARSLGEIGDPGAVTALITALDRSNIYNKKPYIDALVKIGDPRAVEPIHAEIKNKLLHKDIITALAEIGAPAVEALITELRETCAHFSTEGMEVEEGLVMIGFPAVEPLINVMRDKNIQVRKAAAKVLGEIGDPRAVESLIAALWDSDVVGWAANSLGRIGDARAVDRLGEALQRELKKKDDGEAITIVDALGEIGDPRGSSYFHIYEPRNYDDVLYYRMINAGKKIQAHNKDNKIAI